MYEYTPQEVGGHTNRIIRSTATKIYIYEEMLASLLKNKQWKGEIFDDNTTTVSNIIFK